MTKENAITVLQKMITRIDEKKVGEKTYQTYCHGMIDVCNIAIDSISKQIEMSPKLIEDTIFSDTYNCSACGAFLTDSNYKEFVQEDIRFCPACGQKLNWSEKNDD